MYRHPECLPHVIHSNSKTSCGLYGVVWHFDILEVKPPALGRDIGCLVLLSWFCEQQGDFVREVSLFWQTASHKEDSAAFPEDS